MTVCDGLAGFPTIRVCARLARPGTSQAEPGNKIYPYLLHGVAITEPNRVWTCDVTYIPMASGHLYLVAIIDWASRAVLAWRLSNTMDTRFCLDALEEALERHGKPRLRYSPAPPSPASSKRQGEISQAGEGSILTVVPLDGGRMRSSQSKIARAKTPGQGGVVTAKKTPARCCEGRGLKAKSESTHAQARTRAL